MQTNRFIHAFAAAAAVAVAAACSDTSAPSTLTDNLVEADLAASSGDAIATDVVQAVLDEGSFAAAQPMGAAGGAADTSTLAVTRVRTCYTAQDSVIACGPGAVAMRITVTIDGTVQRNNFSGDVHRTRDLMITGLDSSSTTRTHNGVGTSNDTTTFSGALGTRHDEESASDSIINVVFQLPHASHPWPVSGQVVRNVHAVITLTRSDGSTVTRTVDRRVVVLFPADDQGNVAITVGSLSCNLNLVTHRVTCTGS